MSSSPRIVGGLVEAMRHLTERQKVIAQNIANSETAGYKARDVDAPDFGALLNESSAKGKVARPTVNLSARMQQLGASTPRAGSNVVLDEDVVETKPDGNNVTLEEQAMKLAEVQTEFVAATNLYRKQMQLMKIALGSGRG